MAAIYSNRGNCWNILGFNFTKRDALSSVYKISMGGIDRRGATLFHIHSWHNITQPYQEVKHRSKPSNEDESYNSHLRLTSI